MVISIHFVSVFFVELVTLAHIICYNFNNPYKSAELTPSFEHELNYLGANFYVEYATECLMLFAKFNLITLAAKVFRTDT